MRTAIIAHLYQLAWQNADEDIQLFWKMHTATADHLANILPESLFNFDTDFGEPLTLFGHQIYVNDDIPKLTPQYDNLDESIIITTIFEVESWGDLPERPERLFANWIKEGF